MPANFISPCIDAKIKVNMDGDGVLGSCVPYGSRFGISMCLDPRR